METPPLPASSPPSFNFMIKSDSTLFCLMKKRQSSLECQKQTLRWKPGPGRGRDVLDGDTCALPSTVSVLKQRTPKNSDFPQSCAVQRERLCSPASARGGAYLLGRPHTVGAIYPTAELVYAHDGLFIFSLRLWCCRGDEESGLFSLV